MGLFALALSYTMPPIVSGQNSEVGVYHQSLFTWRDHQRSIESGNYIQAFIYAAKRAGGWGFAYREAGYLSATVGPFYDITDWIEIGIGFGAEALKEEGGSSALFARIASILWVGNDKASVTLYYENGTSKQGWYQLDASWHPAEWWAIGVLSQSNAGTGPRISVRIPGLPVDVWATPALYDLSRHRVNSMVGAQFVYSWKRK